MSTREQDLASQEAELRAAGCVRVFTDHGESSRVKDRPQWVKCLEYLNPGDTLVIRALDRIAGGEVMAIETIAELGRREVNIKSLTEPAFDTTTPMGRALFSMNAVYGQLRVDMIRENTLRGLAYARSQGCTITQQSVFPSTGCLPRRLGARMLEVVCYAVPRRVLAVSFFELVRDPAARTLAGQAMVLLRVASRCVTAAMLHSRSSSYQPFPFRETGVDFLIACWESRGSFGQWNSA
ncbi:recombinase family protein [Sinomonas albida]|uniref:recombinase family protein n=1 Tax=Sinomonas albida TaxID=369942 RepID=UPI00301B4325